MLTADFQKGLFTYKEQKIPFSLRVSFWAVYEKETTC